MPGPGTLGTKISKIMDLYKDKPVHICGHIKNYTNHRLFYEGGRMFDGNWAKEPDRIIWQGSEFIFKAFAIPGAFDFDKTKLAFELSFKVEDRPELGTLRIGIFDRCVGYVNWNMHTDDAREARRNGGCSGGETNGILITQDESVAGHPSWELRHPADYSYKCNIEKLVYTDNNGQEKDIPRGVRAQFENAMRDGRTLEVSKRTFSGLQMRSGYVDFECRDGGSATKQRRTFQYNVTLDFGFRIFRVDYGSEDRWSVDHDRSVFAALYASRDGVSGSVRINNGLFGDKDPYYGKWKEIIVRCRKRTEEGQVRVLTFRAKENQSLDMKGSPEIYNK